MPTSNKKSGKKKKRTSTEDFMARSAFSVPTTTESFMQASADGMERLVQQFMTSMQTGAPEDFFAPPEVTTEMKRRIRRLPVNEQTWIAVSITEHTDEGTLLQGNTHLVDKEHGSNGKVLAESDGVSLNISLVATLRPDSNRLNMLHVVLGSIAKACLEPIAHADCMLRPAGTVHPSNMIPPQRPRRLLLQSSGTLELLRDDLADMGITNLAVAESALVTSATSQRIVSDEAAIPMMTGSPNNPYDVRDATVAMLTSNQDYVSEEPIPFGGWKPPEEPGSVPLYWYVRPPEGLTYRCTELWGWRTNLERAIMTFLDVDRIRQICQQRDPEQVREFCECRILLTKAAEKGKLNICEALLDHCGVSVEGVQARNTPQSWKAMQRSAGSKDSTTPLHRASFEGHLQVVELLLKRGASLTAVDLRCQGTALHHAVSRGQLDCVRILCQHGASHSYSSPIGGEPLDLSYCMATQGRHHEQVQRKVREILREYDPRCSNCRADNQPKRCPCGLERYCGVDCQRARWKEHKKLHKERVGGKSS